MSKLKRNIIVAIIVLVSVFVVLKVYADDNKLQGYKKYYSGMLYINGDKIDSNDTVLYSDDEFLFPMRRIFESLGAKVTWNDIEKNTIVEYNKEKYICEINLVNKNFPEVRAITFQNIKNIGKKESSSYLQLNSMGASGSFCMINDYTYLHQNTAERLFSALGCRVEVDVKSKIVYITSYN